MKMATASEESSISREITPSPLSTVTNTIHSNLSSSHERGVPNIYTPLLTSSSLSTCQPPLLSDSSLGNTFQISNSGASKSLKKQTGKSNSELTHHNTKGQRSVVRPFFCCGSELSLVSLVDGLELTDASSRNRKLTSIECNTSSDEEDLSAVNDSHSIQSRENTEKNSVAMMESRYPVLRRKKKEKLHSKKKFWNLRLHARWNPRWRVTQPQRSSALSHHVGYQIGSPGSGRRSPRPRPMSVSSQLIDLSFVQDFDRLYPTEDIDMIRKRERAEEMESGVEVDANVISQTFRQNHALSRPGLNLLHRRTRLGSGSSDLTLPSPDSPIEDYSLLMNNVLWQWQSQSELPRIHTQVDFIHRLVPKLSNILSCPFYWGVMDRYEAERLLDNKPEGTFLLRDSAQEDFLFSVSFRRYNRSLHARVEQWNHRFSFDAHDPAVFSAPSVCELMEHYKDPCCCMFFEPMLTRPLPRNFPFSLQHICRAVICDRVVYDQIRILPLPNSLKQFLQVYHYKQKVRVRVFDGPSLNSPNGALAI
ncbi:Suppressor of cytokine signaling 5 [Bulinus truncatus]|nr:Suppressor of cytokine signaling 5 [Bulinus truncatus]